MTANKVETVVSLSNANSFHINVLYLISTVSIGLHVYTQLTVHLSPPNNINFDLLDQRIEDQLKNYMLNLDSENVGRQRRETRKSGRSVEFIHPKLKEELSGETEDPDNPWVWLTSFSRIPVEAIQEFCASTKEYCPPGRAGEPGTPGLPGLKGTKGEPGPGGPAGFKGSRGHAGVIGPPGPRGPKGRSGKPGLDGRDGLPGDPGLDGVPGRNGMDGLPGLDGLPGDPGESGKPGKNGKDGSDGRRGPAGVPGPRGERGLPGPRGRAGEHGKPGRVGDPGICAWKVTGSNGGECEEVDHLLIPPSISNPDKLNLDRPVIVKERQLLKLTCAVAGDPKPVVSWSRSDNHTIIEGKTLRLSNVIGGVLNITHINRVHMGTYTCTANNGVPPSAVQHFNVEVYFSPTVIVREQVVGGWAGQQVTLECMLEAWPAPVSYWEKDGQLIQGGGRYTISSKKGRLQYQYTTTLSLVVRDRSDEGTYYCVSKNEMGITRGNIQLYERDPNRPPPPKPTGKLEFSYFGDRSPELLGFQDVCPVPPPCPDCAVVGPVRCEGSARIFGVGISAFDPSLPGITNRTEDCTIETVGKPVFKKYTPEEHGGWYSDPVPRYFQEYDKIWSISGNKENMTNKIVREYLDEEKYRDDIIARNHTLRLPFTGTANVVYNGSFFYFNKEKEAIVKVDLTTHEERCLPIPRGKQKGLVEPNMYCNSVYKPPGDFLTKLYPEMGGQIYVDLGVDENGLWAIMAMKENNNTLVLKINSWNLELIWGWNITLNHNLVADMFIACGVLYAADRTDARDTKIRLALDLYTHQMLEIDLPFTNPFRHTTVLGYIPRKHAQDTSSRPGGYLYTWDGGNQLTYPVKYHDIGYKEPPPPTTEPTETRAYTSAPNMIPQVPDT